MAAAVAPVKIPAIQAQATVQAAAGGGAAAQAGVAAERAAAGLRTQATAQSELTRINARGAEAQFKLLTIQEAAIGASSELVAAQRIFAASQKATEAAVEVNNAALRTQDTVLQKHTASLLVDAEAAQKVALAQLEAARTSGVHSGQQSQLTRGAVAQSAAFAGLRGATLAASTPFIAGTVALIAFGKALKSATDLETELNVFQETTRATGDEMERVSATARQLGEDITLPGVSAGDAAQTFTELAKAGLSVEDSLSAARGVLQLATAAQIDNAAAAELTANALNAFGLAGTEAVHVADLLANSANASQGSIEDMGLALQQTAAVARQVGVSLDDTQALLTLFARNGLRGSDAGTSLRTALLRLVNPTREANDLIRSLGLNIRDAQGNVRPEVFAEFGEATAALGPELRDAFAATIFGQDAIRAVAIASREGADGLNEMRTALERQGAAADLANARTKGLAGQVNALQSNLDTLGARLGGVFIPILGNLVETLNLATSAAGKLADALERIPGGSRALGFLTQGPADVLKGVIPPNFRPDEDAEKLKRLGDSIIKNLSPALKDANSQIESFRNADLAGQLEAIDAATRQRVPVDTAGERIAAAAATLKAQLAQLKSAQQEGASEALQEPIKQAIDASIAILESFGPRGAAALRAQGAALAPVLGDALRASLGDITGVDLARPAGITAAVRQQIADIAALGPAGQAELRRIGGLLSASLAEGISDNGQKAVDAARQTLQNVIQQGQEAVRNAIISARSNLEQLGSTITSQLQQIIDAGPIARQIDALEAQLDRLQERVTRRQLTANVREAQQQLENARRVFGTFAGVGQQTASQRKQIEEALTPLEEKVKDAEAARKEFDLQDTIDDLNKMKETIKRTRTEAIEKLILDFENGKIPVQRFIALINDKLGGALKDLPKTNLGMAFTTAFNRNVQTLVDQARAVATFLGIPGTEPGRNVVRPGDTQREAAQREAQARQRLNEAIAQSKKTQDNTKSAADSLKLIESYLRPKGGKTPNTKTPPADAEKEQGRLTGLPR